MNINKALATLDHANQELWTEDGLPLVKLIRDLTGNQELTRADITAADPSFVRAGSSPTGGVNTQPPAASPASEAASEPVAIADHAAQESAVDERPIDQTVSVESLRAKREDLNEQLNQANRELEAKQLEIATLQNRVGDLNTAITRATPDNDNQANIMRYIKQSNEARANRYKRLSDIQKQGILVADLNPKSPIDQALGARNKRDRQRPTPTLQG